MLPHQHNLHQYGYRQCWFLTDTKKLPPTVDSCCGVIRSGRPRSSFGLPLDTHLQKVNDVIDKYFPGYVAAYTEDMGLMVTRE